MHDVDVTLPNRLTHEETAWLVQFVPVALTVAAIILVVFLFRERLQRAILELEIRKAAAKRTVLPAALVPDTSLVWTPPAVPPGKFLLWTTITALVVVVLIGLVAPLVVALIVAIPVTLGVAWLMFRIFEWRYVSKLDADLTEAVGRMYTLLQSGNAFRRALDNLLADLHDGPLRREWSYLLERQGQRLSNREGIATAQDVVAALAAQTPSPRHATFMEHLVSAVGQPQDVITKRVGAAYAALQASDRRRDEANTELSQMRYSGIAVGGAGLVMALYLATTQWERMVTAYTSLIGMFIAPFVVGSLLLPIIGGFLLSRADDLDY